MVSPALSFYPIAADGRRAVSGGGDNQLVVWDLLTGKRIRTISGYHTAGIHGVAITGDGRMAVTAGGRERSMRIWDLETGTHRSPQVGHPRECWRVAVTPDGRTALSSGGVGAAGGSNDYDVRLWKLRD